MGISLGYELRKWCAAVSRQMPIAHRARGEPPGGDDEAAVTAIGEEDIGASAQDEVRHAIVAAEAYRVDQGTYARR